MEWLRTLRTGRFWLRVLSGTIGFLFLVLLMDQVVMPWYTKHGQELELPEVTGKPLPEAVQLLKDHGFHPVIKDSTYDSRYPAGYVVQQRPQAFSTVKEGRRVYLVVSIGEKPQFMPNLLGSTPQDARIRLRDLGLEVNQIIYEFSDLYPRGVVINQSIPPGEQVHRNQTVNLTVSLGPMPSSEVMPNLVGKLLFNAQKELEVLGVPIRRIRYVLRKNLVPNTVVGQSVPAGTPLEKVERVDLSVSVDQLPEATESDTPTDSTRP